MTWDLNWDIIVNMQMMCLSLGQFAKIIASPPSRTVGVISVLIKIKVKKS